MRPSEFLPTRLTLLLTGAQSCLALQPQGRSPPGSSVCGIFLGKNTETSCHFLLQGIFPTQGSNLLHWQTGFFFQALVPPGTPQVSGTIRQLVTF